jgi:hypothetical protein
VLAPHVQDFRGDEPLDQAEHVGVRPALDLAQEPLVARAEEVEAIDFRQPVGQEALAEVEAPAANDVSIDVEADALRDFYDLGIAHRVDVGLQEWIAGLAWQSPDGKWGGHDRPSVGRSVVDARRVVPPTHSRELSFVCRIRLENLRRVHIDLADRRLGGCDDACARDVRHDGSRRIREVTT